MINFDFEIDFNNNSVTSTVDGSCKATSLENVIARAKNLVTQLEGNVEFVAINIWDAAKPNQPPVYFSL